MMMMMTKAMITFSFPPPTAFLRLETCWNVCHLCVHYNRHIQKIPKKTKTGYDPKVATLGILRLCSSSSWPGSKKLCTFFHSDKVGNKHTLSSIPR